MSENRLFGLLSVKAAPVVIKTTENYFYYHHTECSLLRMMIMTMKQ